MNGRHPKPVVKPARKKIIVPPPRMGNMPRPSPRSVNVHSMGLLDSLYEAILIADSNGVLASANVRAGALLGYSVSDFTGKAISQFFPRLDESVFKGIWSDIKDGRYTVMEVPCLRKDGAFMETETSVSAIRWAEKSCACFSIRDNTRHKEQESMLIAANDAIENVATGIVITSVDGLIEFVNPAFLNMAGKQDKSEITGSDVREFFEDTAAIEEMIGSMHDLFVRAHELTLKGCEGGLVAYVSGSPIIDGEGRLNAMVFAVDDMTSLRQSQEQILETERIQARLDTVSTLGYTINSPLQKLLSMAELDNREDYRREVNIIAEIVAELHKNTPLTKNDSKGDGPGYELNVKSANVPCAPGKLLVADDEDMIRALFVRVLTNAFPELRVDIARDGEEAVKKFSEEHYAIMILDMKMPERDGLAVYHGVLDFCAAKGWEMPHVIFCTGFSPTAEIASITGDGSRHGLIQKPVTAAVLADAVKAFLPEAKT